MSYSRQHDYAKESAQRYRDEAALDRSLLNAERARAGLPEFEGPTSSSDFATKQAEKAEAEARRIEEAARAARKEAERAAKALADAELRLSSAQAGGNQNEIWAAESALSFAKSGSESASRDSYKYSGVDTGEDSSGCQVM